MDSWCPNPKAPPYVPNRDSGASLHLLSGTTVSTSHSSLMNYNDSQLQQYNQSVSSPGRCSNSCSSSVQDRVGGGCPMISEDISCSRFNTPDDRGNGRFNLGSNNQSSVEFNSLTHDRGRNDINYWSHHDRGARNIASVDQERNANIYYSSSGITNCQRTSSNYNYDWSSSSPSYASPHSRFSSKDALFPSKSGLTFSKPGGFSPRPGLSNSLARSLCVVLQKSNARRLLTRLFQGAVLFVLILTIAVNVVIVLDKSQQLSGSGPPGRVQGGSFTFRLYSYIQIEFQNLKLHFG